MCSQALQALQRQPNAAQYFQQLMLQQQINNAQLHNLAAVQQVRPVNSSQIKRKPWKGILAKQQNLDWIYEELSSKLKKHDFWKM